MDIYKIITRDQWDEWTAADPWQGAPIDLQDGYIHMSTRGQVQETLDKHFAGQDGLILAAFGLDRFGDDLKWEVSRGGALFPHIFRPLRRDEMRWARDIPMIDGRAVVDWPGPPRTEVADRAPPGGARKTFEALGLKALRALDPETAHGVALRALHTPAVPLPGALRSDRLETRLCDMVLPNPVGLAAGFDKNAEAVDPLQSSGLAHEVRRATRAASQGEPQARLFRLTEDRGVGCNRLRLNRRRDGGDRARLNGKKGGPQEPDSPVGLNPGANRNSAERARDTRRVLRTAAGSHVDFFRHL